MARVTKPTAQPTLSATRKTKTATKPQSYLEKLSETMSPDDLAAFKARMIEVDPETAESIEILGMPRRSHRPA